MFLSGISGRPTTAGVQSQYQQVRNHFKKFSQDPQAGDLTNAQTDFVTLSQSLKAQLSAASPFGQTLNKVGQALQNGDLAAAKNSFTSLRQVGPCAAPKGCHVPPMVNKLTQGLTALGQALQAGDLTGAQQAYAAVQQVWQQMSADPASRATSAVARQA